MMLFDTNPSSDAKMVIVPPKPDAFLSGHHGEEFSYSNLYSYDNTYDHGVSGSSSSAADGTEAPMVATVDSSTSSTTLNSSVVSKSAASSITSFDSSAFDSSAALARRRSNNGLGNNTNNQQQQQQPPPTLRADGRAERQNNNNSAEGSAPPGTITRDPRNGAFTFQVHAEYDLLLHVQKDLDRHRAPNRTINSKTNISNDNGGEDETSIRLSKLIMKSVDGYCLQKQWMYHIGSQKGKAIGRFLRDCAERFHDKLKRGGDERKKFVCVELGTYCGYSALVLASTLRQFVLDQKNSSHDEMETQPSFEFQIYTTEVSTKLLNVAQSVFRLAKVEGCVTPILISADDATKSSPKSSSASSLSSILKNDHGVNNVDFLLLDHAKDRYLQDLQTLENAGLLKAGSFVSADNVVFNRLDAYRDHMHRLGLAGIVESRLEEMNLEYSNNLKDGMEMTVYLKDPPVSN